METFDIITIMCLVIVISVIIGCYIVKIVSDKLSDIQINIPSCPKPNIIINIDKKDLDKYKINVSKLINQNNTNDIIIDNINNNNSKNNNINNINNNDNKNDNINNNDNKIIIESFENNLNNKPSIINNMKTPKYLANLENPDDRDVVNYDIFNCNVDDNINKDDINKDIINKDILNKDDINKDIINKDIINKDDINKNIINKDIINKDDINKDIINKDDINKDIINKNIIKNLNCKIKVNKTGNKILKPNQICNPQVEPENFYKIYKAFPANLNDPKLKGYNIFKYSNLANIHDVGKINLNNNFIYAKPNKYIF